MTLQTGGFSRTVVVHVPTGYGRKRVPLVLNLHGSGSTAAGQEGFSGMDATSDADTFLVAYPQGLIPSGAGYDWNVPGMDLVGGGTVPAGSADDVTFLRQLVPQMEQRYCVDPTRVFATGFSGGARMASQLGCDASTVFAAVAPVSGLRLPSPCNATRAVPIVSFHGTEDPVDPYAGNGAAYWTYSVPAAQVRWSAQDGCTDQPVKTEPDPTVSLITFGGCNGGAEVDLYTIDGEGHEWPGGPHQSPGVAKLLGPQTDAIDADDVMWSFFTAHPLP